MTKVTNCIRCGQSIPTYVQSVQNDTESAEWVKEKYCSRVCYSMAQEETVKKDDTSVNDSQDESDFQGVSEEYSDEDDEQVEYDPDRMSENTAFQFLDTKMTSIPEDYAENLFEEYSIQDMLEDERPMRESDKKGFSTTCKECGIEINNGSDLCSNCNQETVTDIMISDRATAGLILSFIGFFIAGLLMGAAGIIFSISAIYQIKAQPKLYKGMVRAIIALLIGIADVAMSIVGIIL